MLEFDRAGSSQSFSSAANQRHRGRFWTLTSFSLLMEAMGQRLLDFSQPFDVTMLDQVVHTFHSGGPEVRSKEMATVCPAICA